MRAIVSNNQEQSGRKKKQSFWIAIVLMVCLAVGVGVYIISTSLSKSAPGTAGGVSSGELARPTLDVQGSQTAIIAQGQMLLLHGEHFGAQDAITFLLDFTTPIKDREGSTLSVQASNSGAFDVSIYIQASDWSAGPHYIQAVDIRSKQNAYLNIEVSPASIPEATSQNLALSVQGKAVSKLLFTAVIGQVNSAQQTVTFTNTSGANLYWTAAALADHNLNWLMIDNNHIAGNLGIGGTDSIGVSVLTAGLKSNPSAQPYTGQIVFTINGQEQLALPVELQVTDPQPEIVFSPNPVVALLGTKNTCQATTLTLVNLGNSFINWTLVPYDSGARDRIQFIANGHSVIQGTLAASGDSGGTQLLNLYCSGVSAGDTYKFTMYAGSASWLVIIFIRSSS